MAQNKQTDQRPTQDQGGTRPKPELDNDEDAKAKTDKSGMQDEDVEEGDESEGEEE